MATFNLNPPIKEPVIMNGIVSPAWANYFLKLSRFLKVNEIGGIGDFVGPDSSTDNDPLSVTGNNIYNCSEALYYDGSIYYSQVGDDGGLYPGYFSDGHAVFYSGNTNYNNNESTVP